MLYPEDSKVTNKMCSFTSCVKQVAGVGFLSNPVQFRNVTADLKILAVTEMQMILNVRIIYNHIHECAKIINFLYGMPVLIDIFRILAGLRVCQYSAVRFFNEPTEAVTKLCFSDFSYLVECG
jgi:hypothetical protein